jgi:hypothetical protein
MAQERVDPAALAGAYRAENALLTAGTSEDTPPAFRLQARQIASRFGLPLAQARTVAALAFGEGAA